MDNININIENRQNVTVVEIDGDIDANTAPAVQEKVLPLAEPGSKILLDLSKVHYTSSAGLRLLLSLYRQVTTKNGRLVLVGVSEEIQDTMEITGFLDFFKIKDDQEAGLKEIFSESEPTPGTSHQEKSSKA